ncbi:MAG: F-ATPase epsilon subunit [Candidatus Accumulibacter phosphatis]|jgi:F-type H+-transporting ATPase subunit epsilon|uniref:ATP synthase epsilon chain n=2 Tax=Candidatus Accumulibacter TaxID=327159 RepID=A0A080M2V5_9PROT|nr:MAG: F-ATPase epsilon subunit [Candidatus Accumulibacter phosphatis]
MSFPGALRAWDTAQQGKTMAIRVHVDVVSAEELIFSGETDFAVFPGEAGELGIYPRHTPLLTRIRPGTVRLKVPDRDEYEMVYVSGGMLEVQPALITVLADTAIRAHDLDEAKAMESKRRAEEALKNRSSEVGLATAEAELAQAVAQLQAIKRLRKRH